MYRSHSCAVERRAGIAGFDTPSQHAGVILLMTTLCVACVIRVGPLNAQEPASIEDRSAQQMFEAARRAHRGVDAVVNLERALRLYEQAAERGSADAAFSLGNLYLLGEGVVADEQRALEYYRAAADRGHVLAARNYQELQRAMGIDPEEPATSEPPDAVAPAPLDISSIADSDDERLALQLAQQYGMTIRLDNGAVLTPQPAGDIEHVEPGDITRINPPLRNLESDRLAADPEENFRLAERYYHGDGIDKDEAMAITLYRTAAEQGHPLAQRRLLAIYQAAGLPVPAFIRAEPAP